MGSITADHALADGPDLMASDISSSFWGDRLMIYRQHLQRYPIMLPNIEIPVEPEVTQGPLREMTMNIPVGLVAIPVWRWILLAFPR